jgi:23S rRNA (uracil1939-C5)-methyltransferase
MALHLARHSGRVLGIEEFAPAVEDARANARLNEIANAAFEAGRVEDILAELDWAPDVLVMDPPRKGCHPAVLEAIARRRVRRLVYVSCNPSTQARDLGWLVEHGYGVRSLQPLDMFPQTVHVECVAVLEAV